MSERTVRDAFRSALAAHRRAIEVHERAAVVHERAGKGERAARERAAAARERERLFAAQQLHPDWCKSVTDHRPGNVRTVCATQPKLVD